MRLLPRMVRRDGWLLLAVFALTLGLAGCQEKRKKTNRVDVRVNTPKGVYGVQVDYDDD
jgi:hypothetical protein